MLRSVLIQTIGEYTPIPIDGGFSIDFPWIVSGLLLCVALYSIFRLIGALFK